MPQLSTHGKIKTGDSGSRHQFPESLEEGVRGNMPSCCALHMSSIAGASSRHRFDSWCPTVERIGLLFGPWKLTTQCITELIVPSSQSEPSAHHPFGHASDQVLCVMLDATSFEWPSMVVVPQIERYHFQQDRGGCHILWVVLYSGQSSN